MPKCVPWRHAWFGCGAHGQERQAEDGRARRHPGRPAAKKPPIKLRRIGEASSSSHRSPPTSGRQPHYPDFPRAAELAAAIVGKRWKESYDGAIGVDPVTLGYLLDGIGAVEVGDNVTLDSATPSRCCSTGSTSSIRQMASGKTTCSRRRRAGSSTPTVGRGDPSLRSARSFAASLSDGSCSGRATTPSRSASRAGISPDRSRTAGRPQVGVYVNERLRTKMEYYLRMGTTVRSLRCLDSDSQELRMTTTLITNASNARQLPPSVGGLGDIVDQATCCSV